MHVLPVHDDGFVQPPVGFAVLLFHRRVEQVQQQILEPRGVAVYEPEPQGPGPQSGIEILVEIQHAFVHVELVDGEFRLESAQHDALGVKHHLQDLDHLAQRIVFFEVRILGFFFRKHLELVHAVVEPDGFQLALVDPLVQLAEPETPPVPVELLEHVIVVIEVERPEHVDGLGLEAGIAIRQLPFGRELTELGLGGGGIQFLDRAADPPFDLYFLGGPLVVLLFLAARHTISDSENKRCLKPNVGRYGEGRSVRGRRGRNDLGLKRIGSRLRDRRGGEMRQRERL